MIFFVIIINLLITVVNIYLAVKILQLKKVLVRTTSALINCEQIIHSVLYSAPQSIFKGQKNLHHIRQQYQLLQLQLQKIRQFLLLLSLIYRFGRSRLSVK